jgi:hypothetical protein
VSDRANLLGIYEYLENPVVIPIVSKTDTALIAVIADGSGSGGSGGSVLVFSKNERQVRNIPLESPKQHLIKPLAYLAVITETAASKVVPMISKTELRLELHNILHNTKRHLLPV